MKKLFSVSAMIIAINKLDFHVTVNEIEAYRETERSISFSKRRINKSDIGKEVVIADQPNMIGYKMFVWEGDVENAKARVVELIRTLIQERIVHYTMLKAEANKTPEVKVGVWKYD